MATWADLDMLDDLLECVLNVVDHLQLVFAQGSFGDVIAVVHRNFHNPIAEGR